MKGPSITPRPPQGQPVVAVLAHVPRVYEFAARSADLVFVTPTDDASVRRLLGEVADAGGTDLQVYADLVVSIGGDTEFGSDAAIFGGTADELTQLLLAWHDLGVDGVRLRPAVHATDLPTIVDEVVPRLQRAGRFRTAYRPSESLRARLGLPLAENRFVRTS